MCGHHYAVVSVTGLESDTRYPYEVLVDGERAWPPPVSPYPDSVLRTRGPESARQHRIIFGSCRYAKVVVPKQARQLGIDALDAYAARMAQLSPDEWPDALLLLGDQVYAGGWSTSWHSGRPNSPDSHSPHHPTPGDPVLSA